MPRCVRHVLVYMDSDARRNGWARIPYHQHQNLAVLVSGADISPHVGLHRRFELTLLILDLPPRQEG